MSIQRKLLLAFMALAFLVLTVGSYTIKSSFEAEQDSEALVNGTVKQIEALLSLAHHLETTTSNMREILLEYAKEYHEDLAGLELGEIEHSRKLINDGIKGARNDLLVLEAALSHEGLFSNAVRSNRHTEHIKIYKELQQQLLPVLDLQKHFLSDFDTKGRFAAYTRFEKELEPKLRYLHSQVVKLMEQEQKEVDIITQELFSAAQNTIMANAIGILAAFLGALVLGLLVARSISRPLDRLTQAAHQISVGELEKPVNLNMGGELKLLAQTFNGMTKSLKEYRDEMEQKVEARTAELETAKRVAEEASKAKSKFLSRMSHELRTPMNAVLGFGQLLHEEEVDTEKREQLESILSAGNHLLQLIDEVLDISRIDAGHMELSLENVALAPVLGECLSLVRPMGEKSNIEICGDYQDVPWVMTDAFRLRQVLLNLLSNAVKYNREGGKVTVSHQTIDEATVRLNIADTGQGIAPERQALVFEPFSRVAINAEVIEGTGIGLTITKKLVELMRGSIGFDSEPDKGSTFWIELPLGSCIVDEEDSNQDSVQEEYLAENFHHGECQVLYVEDDPVSVRVMDKLLKKYSKCTLLSAHSAELGLEIAANHKPNLIILDVNLPGMSGIDAFRQLRTMPETANTPVIALSANAMPEDVNNGLAEGFAAYLTKPLDIPLFHKTINKALDRLNH